MFKGASLLLLLSFLGTHILSETMFFTEILQSNRGPFHYSLLHTAHTQGGQGGKVLSYFALDKEKDNYWDTTEGDLRLSVILYNSIDLLETVGWANIVGNDFTPDKLGKLAWSFKTLGHNPLATYLDEHFSEQEGHHLMNISFLPQYYVTSSEGYQANSYKNNVLTLWGQSDSCGDYALGVDFVGYTDAVPEPSSYLIMIIAALLLYCRQKVVNQEKTA